jgi:hypothetical protein
MSSRGSSQNIVIILLVFPAVWMSLRDYLRIYSGKYLLIKINFTSKILKFIHIFVKHLMTDFCLLQSHLLSQSGNNTVVL